MQGVFAYYRLIVGGLLGARSQVSAAGSALSFLSCHHSLKPSLRIINLPLEQVCPLLQVTTDVSHFAVHVRSLAAVKAKNREEGAGRGLGPEAPCRKSHSQHARPPAQTGGAMRLARPETPQNLPDLHGYLRAATIVPSLEESARGPSLFLGSLGMARSIRGWCFFEGALGRPASEQGGAPSMAPSATFRRCCSPTSRELRRLALEGPSRLQAQSRSELGYCPVGLSSYAFWRFNAPRGGHTPSSDRAASTLSTPGVRPVGRLEAALSRRQTRSLLWNSPRGQKWEAKAWGALNTNRRLASHE
jgi:hypothetical protein